MRKLVDASLAKKYGWKSKFSLEEGLILHLKILKIYEKKIIVTGGCGFVDLT